VTPFFAASLTVNVFLASASIAAFVHLNMLAKEYPAELATRLNDRRLFEVVLVVLVMFTLFNLACLAGGASGNWAIICSLLITVASIATFIWAAVTKYLWILGHPLPEVLAQLLSKDPTPQKLVLLARLAQFRASAGDVQGWQGAMDALEAQTLALLRDPAPKMASPSVSAAIERVHAIQETIAEVLHGFRGSDPLGIGGDFSIRVCEYVGSVGHTSIRLGQDAVASQCVGFLFAMLWVSVSDGGSRGSIPRILVGVSNLAAVCAGSHSGQVTTMIGEGLVKVVRTMPVAAMGELLLALRPTCMLIWQAFARAGEWPMAEHIVEVLTVLGRAAADQHWGWQQALILSAIADLTSNCCSFEPAERRVLAAPLLRASVLVAVAATGPKSDLLIRDAVQAVSSALEALDSPEITADFHRFLQTHGASAFSSLLGGPNRLSAGRPQLPAGGGANGLKEPSEG
jgi:hypothetical protein